MRIFKLFNNFGEIITKNNKSNTYFRLTDAKRGLIQFLRHQKPNKPKLKSEDCFIREYELVSKDTTGFSMPTYEYRCDFCEASEEVFQGIHEKPKRKCSACGRLSLQRLISACIGFVAREATTLGQMAERNTKKMGSKIKEEEERSGKALRKKRAREINEINRMTDKEKIKYIEEG